MRYSVPVFVLSILMSVSQGLYCKLFLYYLDPVKMVERGEGCRQCLEEPVIVSLATEGLINVECKHCQ